MNPFRAFRSTIHRIAPALLTLAVLAVAPLATGCGSDAAAPRDLEVVRITPNAPGLVYFSGVSSSVRAAVTDARTFERLWDQAFDAEAARRQMPVPQIDFTKQMVLFVALGERATGGFSIEVIDAEVSHGDLVIDVLTRGPGNGAAPAVMTQPLDIVKIPRVSGRVQFVEHSRR